MNAKDKAMYARVKMMEDVKRDCKPWQDFKKKWKKAPELGTEEYTQYAKECNEAQRKVQEMFTEREKKE